MGCPLGSKAKWRASPQGNVVCGVEFDPVEPTEISQTLSRPQSTGTGKQLLGMNAQDGGMRREVLRDHRVLARDVPQPRRMTGHQGT